jgi:hypothetical protein
MAHGTHVHTAKIYQFPLTVRTGRRQQNFEAAMVITDKRFERAPIVIYDGWYHDDAIKADRKPNS